MKSNLGDGGDVTHLTCDLMYRGLCEIVHMWSCERKGTCLKESTWATDVVTWKRHCHSVKVACQHTYIWPTVFPLVFALIFFDHINDTYNNKKTSEAHNMCTSKYIVSIFKTPIISFFIIIETNNYNFSSVFYSELYSINACLWVNSCLSLTLKFIIFAICLFLPLEIFFLSSCVFSAGILF